MNISTLGLPPRKLALGPFLAGLQIVPAHLDDQTQGRPEAVYNIENFDKTQERAWLAYFSASPRRIAKVITMYARYAIPWRWAAHVPLTTTLDGARVAKLFRLCIENERCLTTCHDGFRRKTVCRIAWSEETAIECYKSEKKLNFVQQ